MPGIPRLNQSEPCASDDLSRLVFPRTLHRGSVKSKSVFAAVGVLAAALVVWLWSGQGDVPSVTAREAAGGPAQTREQELASDPAPIPTRVPVLEAPREEPNGPPVQVPDEAIHVVGSVRDREGRPIPGAHVLAKMHAGTACTTDAGGAFRLPSAIRLGTKLILQVRCPRYLATEVDVVVRIESPTVVELDRAPRISGTLVDPRGEPIEGYRLQALSDADKPLAFGITDSAGKFDLCRKDSNPDGFVTVSEMYTYGHGMLVDRPRVAWGTEDLELRARSSGEFELRVTRGDDGAPVTAFAVCLLHAEHQGPQGWDPRRPVRVASDEGVTRVRCIPGPVSAIVIPDDLDLQPSTTPGPARARDRSADRSRRGGRDGADRRRRIRRRTPFRRDAAGRRRGPRDPDADLASHRDCREGHDGRQRRGHGARRGSGRAGQHRVRAPGLPAGERPTCD